MLDPSVFQTPCDAGTIGSTSPYAANISDTDYAVSLTRGLESGTGTGFSFINLTAGDADFLAAGSNMTNYILNTYDTLSHTRRAATTFEDPVNPVTAFSALLEAGEGTFLAKEKGLGGSPHFASPRLNTALHLCFTASVHVARAWFDNRHYHSLPASMHMINNAILQAETSGSGKVYTATILNYPLNSTADEKTQVRERARVSFVVLCFPLSRRRF